MTYTISLELECKGPKEWLNHVGINVRSVKPEAFWPGTKSAWTVGLEYMGT